MVTLSQEAPHPHLLGLHFPLPRLVLGDVTQISSRALPLSLQLAHSEKKRNKRIQHVTFDQETDTGGASNSFTRSNLKFKREQTAPSNLVKWASLVVQWLRICLPMQGTRFRALVWEDPTCRGATRPVSLCVWSLCSARREAATVRGPRTSMKSGLRLTQLEKALAQKQRPNTAINK